MNFNGRCCVFQPFDRAAFDKRYEGTLVPAIEDAGLEPYRVDRDEGAVIPIEALHDEIRAAKICLSDITTRNPNVMYELGYAIAAGKDVVIICSTQEHESFPFDIRHRGIIQYTPESISDLNQLKANVTNKIAALLKKQEISQEIVATVAASPVKNTEGLLPNEVAALALVMANVDSSDDKVTASTIKSDMEAAGYNRLATQLALTRLTKLEMVEPVQMQDGYEITLSIECYQEGKTGSLTINKG
jgi:hypothetical protein